MPRVVKTAPPRRRNETRDIVNPLLDALNRLPDVMAMRNANLGPVTPLRAPGQVLSAGLGPGSPDIIAILAPAGRFVALECKQPGQKPDPHQSSWLQSAQKLGAFTAVVHSVAEGLDAVERARAER